MQASAGYITGSRHGNLVLPLGRWQLWGGEAELELSAKNGPSWPSAVKPSN